MNRRQTLARPVSPEMGSRSNAPVTEAVVGQFHVELGFNDHTHPTYQFTGINSGVSTNPQRPIFSWEGCSGYTYPSEHYWIFDARAYA